LNVKRKKRMIMLHLNPHYKPIQPPEHLRQCHWNEQN
jgi:hypothetical protein